MYLTAQELPAGGMHGVVASKYLVYRSRSIGRHGRELLTGTRRMSTQASLPWWEGGCTPIHHTVSDWSCLGEEDAGGGAQAATVRALSAARERHAAFRQLLLWNQKLFHASARHQTQSCSGCHGMASLRQLRERTCAFSCRTRLPLTSWRRRERRPGWLCMQGTNDWHSNRNLLCTHYLLQTCYSIFSLQIIQILHYSHLTEDGRHPELLWKKNVDIWVIADSTMSYSTHAPFFCVVFHLVI
jgi:hypothetical protein